MKTKRSQEGVVLIDHRNSPGISNEFIRANGLEGVAPAVGAGQVYESALLVCSHCGTDVILNPDRSRDRGWCMTCDKYLCDPCTALKHAGVPCSPVMKKLEAAWNELDRKSTLII